MRKTLLFLSLVVGLVGACKSGAKSSSLAIPAKGAPLSSGVKIETVEAPEKADGDTGLWPNVLVGADGPGVQGRAAQGGVHIVYCDGYMGDLKVAHRDAKGAFKVEIIEQKGAVGKYATAVLGPAGIEVVHFDQTRKQLRYTVQKGGAWQSQDIATDQDDLGISGRLVVSPKGERLVLHYNTRNELLLTRGAVAEGGLKWTTHLLARAGVTYQIHLGAVLMPDGTLGFTYPDWKVSTASLYLGTLPPGGTAITTKTLNEEGIAGLKSVLLGQAPSWRVLAMNGRGGALSLIEGDPPSRVILTDNVANFDARETADGRLVIVMQTGLKEGLGEGQLELAVRDKAGAWQRTVLDATRPVGQYLSVAESAGEGGRAKLHIAYYDGLKKALRYLEIF